MYRSIVLTFLMITGCSGRSVPLEQQKTGCSGRSVPLEQQKNDLTERRKFCLSVVESPIFQDPGTVVAMLSISAPAFHLPPPRSLYANSGWVKIEEYIDQLFKTNETDALLIFEYTTLRVIRQWYAEDLGKNATLEERNKVASWREIIIQRLGLEEHSVIRVVMPPQVEKYLQENGGKKKRKKILKK